MSLANNTDFSGIVMFERSHRENDLLVKILTREYGKQMFFVRNAKKMEFKLRSAILPFSHGRYAGFLRDNGLSYINAAIEVDQFENIFQDISLNAYAVFILNLIDAAYEDHVKIEAWYDRIVRALYLIDAGNDAEVIADIIQLQLMNTFGYLYNFQSCVECGRNDIPLDFSEKFGGMLCQNHFEMDEHRWHLTAKSSQILAKLVSTEIFNLGQVSVSEDTKTQIWNLTDSIYKNQIGINLKSRSFIDQMKNWKI